ncbi:MULTISPECIES: TetR/AcrR family transcriptional regulator C-terminal domain-containing protein [Streptomyces]|uniref:TetR/AcrR family transcriptional regulator C-terminal domain-containing protein n=1 Tax=Streptomyces TaxID=1883 RepID=UPI00163B983A|nr:MULTISPECIES: TetR/AcrR family transcriptional regulator C-terminal domain-containing protein [Streptomyces]MBC2876526.1 TetR/AcrR family transcriptional regulator C-terminal domain-containing protein [Streptomyces sp. TYQ1024]UBI40801.1 TetR/AcrR family transcriptional regulator C-terminal domain-containing protein [Streptomyces mobaraensis]
MTKKQGTADRSKVGITLDHVVGAAFDVLDRGGIGKLSTRAIAAELGVSMNTVMWHIRSKDRLLDAMAEAVLGEVGLEDLPEEWDEQAAELLGRLRRAMLGHRDGAALVAGTFPAEPRTLAVADRLLTALLRGCPDRRSAAWTAWNLFYFTLGLVQEEQAVPATGARDRLRAGVDVREFPGLGAALEDFLSVDFEARFRFGVGQILRAAALPAAPGGPPGQGRGISR